jgi:hypothetical protein
MYGKTRNLILVETFPKNEVLGKPLLLRYWEFVVPVEPGFFA